MTIFRELFMKLVAPLARLLVACRVHPNILSISSIAFASLAAHRYISQEFLPAILFLILSQLVDAVDGSVARLQERDSAFGAVFDEFCGVYTDLVVLGGLIVGGLCDPAWGMAAMVGIVGRVVTSKSRLFDRFPYGPGGKGDRTVLLILGTVSGHIPTAIVAMAVLTNLTAAFRLAKCYYLDRDGQLD